MLTNYAIFTFSENDEAARRNTLSCGVLSPCGFSTSCPLNVTSPSFTTVYSTSSAESFSTSSLFCVSPIVSEAQEFEPSLNSLRLTELMALKFAAKFLNLRPSAVGIRATSGVSESKDFCFCLTGSDFSHSKLENIHVWNTSSFKFGADGRADLNCHKPITQNKKVTCLICPRNSIPQWQNFIHNFSREIFRICKTSISCRYKGPSYLLSNILLLNCRKFRDQERG